MNVVGQRIIVFGDSLSHHGADNAPEIWDVDQGSQRFSGQPGDLLASMLLESGAAAVRVNARVSRSAVNFFGRENAQALLNADASFQPSLVLIILGTNDLGLNPQADAQAFEQLKATYENMGAEVWAIGPFTYNDASANILAPQTIEVMKSVFGRRFIDGRALSVQEGRAGDGVHFGAQSAAVTAANLLEAVKSASVIPGGTWGALAIGAVAILIGSAAFSWFHRRRANALTGSTMTLEGDRKPFKIATVDPATMTAAQVNKELDKLAVQDSTLGDEMIAAGRGHERPSEYLKMTDPLSRELLANYERRSALRSEIELRYGPGAPSRFPVGDPRYRGYFKPRRSKDELEGVERDASKLIHNWWEGNDLEGPFDDETEGHDVTFRRKHRFKKLITDQSSNALDVAEDFAEEQGVTITSLLNKDPAHDAKDLERDLNVSGEINMSDWQNPEDNTIVRWTIMPTPKNPRSEQPLRANIMWEVWRHSRGDENYARMDITGYRASNGVEMIREATAKGWTAAQLLKKREDEPNDVVRAEIKQMVSPYPSAVRGAMAIKPHLFGLGTRIGPTSHKRSFAETRETFDSLVREDTPQWSIAEDVLKEDGETLRDMMNGKRVLHYSLATKEFPGDPDYAKKERRVGGGFTPATKDGKDDRTRASWISFYVQHGPSRYRFEKKLDKPIDADDARKMITATIWELSKRLAPFSNDADEATIQRIAEKTIKQRHNIVKRYAEIAGLGGDVPEGYRVAYGLVTRRDGKIVTVREVVKAPRPLTLAEAEKWRRQYKNAGSHSWVETMDGKHVPVKGAMKPGSFIDDARSGDVHATLTMPR